jgi:excisionase family DNA binding protein
VGGFLTAEELSKWLRVPKRTVYKFAQEGVIPGTIRIGKHWRFRQDMVSDWIERVTVRVTIVKKDTEVLGEPG